MNDLDKRVKEIRTEDNECQDCGGDGWDSRHTGLSVEGAKCVWCDNTGKDLRVKDLLEAYDDMKSKFTSMQESFRIISNQLVCEEDGCHEPRSDYCDVHTVDNY